MKYFVAMGIVLVFLSPCLLLHAQNPVGIILGGYEENCEITHNGKTHDCDDRRDLYVGDVVKKKPSAKALKIKWAPYAKGAPRGEIFLEVVTNKPEKLKGDTFAGMVKQYINDFIKPTEYGTSAAVTRDPKSKGQLPLTVSMLDSFPFHISKSGENIRSISITDGEGKVVYQKQITAESDLVIDVAKIRLRQGDSYVANVARESGITKITVFLLNKDLQTEVLKGLADIDSERLSETDRMIRKATFLQLISDAYPEKVDLYWLSDQILRDSSLHFSKEQKATADVLRHRYLNHFIKKE